MLPKLGFLDTYSIFLIIGMFSALFLVEVYYRTNHFDKNKMTALELLAIISIILGLAFANLFQNVYDFIQNSKDFSWSWNFTFYGGLLGGAAVFLLGYFIVVRRIYGPCLNEALKIAPASITTGHAFGRIGCFLHGCCYGKPTNSWLGVQFTTTAEKVYPTNLFEAIFLFILSGILFFLAMKKLGKWCFPIYMMSYGVWRFFIEYLRGDYRGSFIPGLTPSQFWSIILFLGGIAYLIVLIVLWRKGKRLII